MESDQRPDLITLRRQSFDKVSILNQVESNNLAQNRTPVMLPIVILET